MTWCFVVVRGTPAWVAFVWPTATVKTRRVGTVTWVYALWLGLVVQGEYFAAGFGSTAPITAAQRGVLTLSRRVAAVAAVFVWWQYVEDDSWWVLVWLFSALSFSGALPRHFGVWLELHGLSPCCGLFGYAPGAPRRVLGSELQILSVGAA